MVNGFLNPNITPLGEKLWLVAWKQKFTSVCYIKKKSKNANKKKSKIKLQKKNKALSSRIGPIMNTAWFLDLGYSEHSKFRSRTG